MRILHAFLKFLVIALSGLCALERVHAQAGCGCDPAGIRGWVNFTNGPWHGYLPFETSPGLFELAKVQEKYLKHTWFTEAFITTEYSAGNASGNCWTAVNGTAWYKSEITYAASQTTTVSTNSGAVVSDVFDGVDDYWDLETDSRLNNRTCFPSRAWTSVTNSTDRQRTLTTGPGLGNGTWTQSETWATKQYQTSPTTEWITGGGTTTGSWTVGGIWIVGGLTTTAPTIQTTSTIYWDPIIGQEGFAATDEVVSEVYDKVAFRDFLVSRLNPANEQLAEGSAACSFGIAGNRATGDVQRLTGLQGYVLGEAGRPYLVWYRKTTVLLSGLSTVEDLSVKITGAGTDTEAVVAIPHDPVPPGEGTITYAFLRLQPLDIASSGPNAGPPGSGGGNGGGQGGSGSGGGAGRGG